MNKEELLEFIKENLTLELEYKEGSYYDAKKIIIRLNYNENFNTETLLESTAWLS